MIQVYCTFTRVCSVSNVRSIILKWIEKIFTDEKLIFAQEVIEEQRMIKDDEEIKCIKRAAEITDYAFSHITQFVKPGLSEREIALELEFFMKKEGAFGLS